MPPRSSSLSTAAPSAFESFTADSTSSSRILSKRSLSVMDPLMSRIRFSTESTFRFKSFMNRLKFPASRPNSSFVRMSRAAVKSPMDTRRNPSSTLPMRFEICLASTRERNTATTPMRAVRLQPRMRMRRRMMAL